MVCVEEGRAKTLLGKQRGRRGGLQGNLRTLTLSTSQARPCGCCLGSSVLHMPGRCWYPSDSPRYVMLSHMKSMPRSQNP